MKRSFKITGLLMLFMLGINIAKAQVRVYVNVGPVIPPCRSNVVYVPAPAPVVYYSGHTCHSNCNHYHGHHYNNNHHYYNGNNYGAHNHGYKNGYNNGGNDRNNGSNGNFGNHGNNGNNNRRR